MAASVTGRFTKLVERTWDLRKTVKNKMGSEEITHSRRQEVIQNTDTASRMQLDEDIRAINATLTTINATLVSIDNHLAVLASKPHTGG